MSNKKLNKAKKRIAELERRNFQMALHMKNLFVTNQMLNQQNELLKVAKMRDEALSNGDESVVAGIVTHGELWIDGERVY